MSTKYVTFSAKGDLKKTETYLRKLLKLDLSNILHKYGQKGVDILSAATPVRTGATASSWEYDGEFNKNHAVLYWYNTNMSKWDTPIVYFIVYGHGTRNGGYVPPQDFVTPAMEPLFNELTAEIMKEVAK